MGPLHYLLVVDYNPRLLQLNDDQDQGALHLLDGSTQADEQMIAM
jgi:hypothetical protein